MGVELSVKVEQAVINAAPLIVQVGLSQISFGTYRQGDYLMLLQGGGKRI